MKIEFRILLRLALTIVFGFIGALVARSGTPPIFYFAGSYFMLIAVFFFGILGFIMPDIVEVAGRAGIAVLARQIASYIAATGGVARSAVPKISFPKRQTNKKYINPLVVDTSALIDGRLVDIVRFNFIFGTFLILPSVVGELHSLSDSADDRKRAKGRRGLDNLRSIQATHKVKVEILKTEPKDEKVDHKLVSMAKKVKGKIVTVDFNLGKVAAISKVPILNVNELANASRTVYSAGDRLALDIVAKGKESGQGVGYLEDGTMVVVEDAISKKGKKVDVEVRRILQTTAGKMIFAQLL